MTIYSVYIVNKSGGLIYQKDYHKPPQENEKTFSYPLELKLEAKSDGVCVVFGQRDGIKVGHVVMSVNGKNAQGKKLEDGTDVLETINNEKNYPMSIKFGRPTLTSNEKLMMASMFHSLYAISVQLSPEHKSSGIQKLEVDTFLLQCYQTNTGVKFIVIAEPRQSGLDGLLHKLYSVYSDYALKNPFYSLEMPIRAELFDQSVMSIVGQIEKTGALA